MRTLSVFGLVLLGVVCGRDAAADEDYAKKIVGVWEVSKGGGAPAGAIAEFTKDGKVSVVVKQDGKELKAEGTYKVEKDKLITKITLNGKTAEDTDEIIKLTDDTMEIRDKDKKTTTFKKKK
jgi:uncharacterized protein (TIGR03066 family)